MPTLYTTNDYVPERTGSKAPFKRDRIQMGSDPLFEGRLHGMGSRTVGVFFLFFFNLFNVG